MVSEIDELIKWCRKIGHPSYSQDSALVIENMHRALARVEAAPQPDKLPAGWCSMGVGDGSGNLFVHGAHAAIKACQQRIIASEAAHQPNTVAVEQDERAEFEEWVKVHFSGTTAHVVDACWDAWQARALLDQEK